MNNPKSKTDADLDSLFARARAERLDTSSMEYAFETRLMAKLRSRQEPGSIWALVSWRMMPFFVACVLALAVWRQEVVTETDDATQAAYMDNPNTLEAGTNLDL